MGHKVTEKIIQIAENLERLARLKEAEKKQYAVKVICSTEHKYIENALFVKPESETGAFITPNGTLIYYIKF